MMRFRRGYWINGRWWKVKWTDAGSLGAADFNTRTLEFHKDLRGEDEAAQREVLYHELLHAKWERAIDARRDTHHYTWEVKHNDFARYAAMLVRLEKTGTDASAASIRAASAGRR